MARARRGRRERGQAAAVRPAPAYVTRRLPPYALLEDEGLERLDVPLQTTSHHGRVVPVIRNYRGAGERLARLAHGLASFDSRGLWCGRYHGEEAKWEGTFPPPAGCYDARTDTIRHSDDPPGRRRRPGVSSDRGAGSMDTDDDEYVAAARKAVSELVPTTKKGDLSHLSQAYANGLRQHIPATVGKKRGSCHLAVEPDDPLLAAEGGEYPKVGRHGSGRVPPDHCGCRRP